MKGGRTNLVVRHQVGQDRYVLGYESSRIGFSFGGVVVL